MSAPVSARTKMRVSGERCGDTAAHANWIQQTSALTMEMVLGAMLRGTYSSEGRQTRSSSHSSNLSVDTAT